MLKDLRLGVRMLLQAKGWTAAIVVSLALGIGANTVLFNAANGLLLTKLAVSDPDSLVRFRYVGRNQMRTDVLIYGFTRSDAEGRPIEPTFSYPMYRAFVAQNRTLTDLFACAPLRAVSVMVGGQAEIATAFLSSGNYYRVLGARARLGRTIAPDDDRPTAAAVATLSHKYWMQRFGGSTDVVGTTARINNVAVTIVGVLEPGFAGVERALGDAPDVSLPLALEPQVNLQPSNLQRSLLPAANFWWLHVMGRLRPGVTAVQAQANFAGVFAHAARGQFESFLASLPAEERSRAYLQNHTEVPELLVDSGSRGIYDVDTGELRSVTLLSGVVALVLLIVCANVANLLLSRSTARRKELSVRLALGATRARLVRQLLTESLLLAGLGGALGLVVARWGQELLPPTTGRAAPLDWHVLAFVAAVSLLTGVVSGIMPAVHGVRVTPGAALTENRGTIGSSQRRLGKALVVVQVTISVVVLVGAGLFVQTVENLRRVDVGFNPRNLVLFRVSPALNRYESGKQNALYAQIADRLRAIGGVRAVAWSNPSLMSDRRFRTSLFVHGRRYDSGQENSISQMTVSPSFFDTMEIPLLAGRGFRTPDTDTAPRVVVINQAAARKYFPGEFPIGRRVGPSVEDAGALEVIGVVRDAKYNSLRDPPVPTIYMPALQDPPGSATYEVRTAADPGPVMSRIREAVRQVDPALPLVNLTTQERQIEGRFAQEKLIARTYALFGALALFVASVGVFGLMSYSVARRTNEVGLRMALGAGRDDVLRLILRESMILVATGVLLGLAVAIGAGRFIASLLFGLAATDVKTLAGAVAIMLLLSALAAYLPARRASRVDPTAALRYE